jgi:hypothetical protein
MERTASKFMTAQLIPPGRHFRVGVLGAVFSASTLALVPAVASALFGPVVIPPDEAVTSGQVVAARVAGRAGRLCYSRSSTGSPCAPYAPSGASRPPVCCFHSFRSPWRASRDRLRERWV